VVAIISPGRTGSWRRMEVGAFFAHRMSLAKPRPARDVGIGSTRGTRGILRPSWTSIAAASSSSPGSHSPVRERGGPTRRRAERVCAACTARPGTR
jgi:hypothetical protein